MDLPSQDVAAVVVEVACASAEEAARIGSAAVVRDLAASAQHFPVTSVYRWEEEVRHASEEVLRMVTTRAAVSALCAHVRSEASGLAGPPD